MSIKGLRGQERMPERNVAENGAPEGERRRRKNMETALITGASSGIGRELARVFAEKGHDLVLVGRNEERLRGMARELDEGYGIGALALVADLSVEGSPERVANEVESRGIRIDILVNNAGMGDYGPFRWSDLKRIKDMIAVNIRALTVLTHLFLPKMISKGHGRILNVGSVAGFSPGPYMSVYYATKAYVLSFSEALSVELKNENVSVSVLCPGTTDTEFFRRAGVVSNPPGRMGMMDPRAVAEAGYLGMMKEKAIIIPGLRNRLVSVLPRFFPRWMVRAAVGRMQNAGKMGEQGKLSEGDTKTEK